jgi:hypothetical protein
MTQLKISEKLYERFSPVERAKLTLVALSKNDGEELRQLINNCPIKKSECTDLNYVNQIHAIKYVANLFGKLVMHFYNLTVEQEHFIRAMQLCEKGTRLAWLTKMNGHTPDLDNTEIDEPEKNSIAYEEKMEEANIYFSVYVAILNAAFEALLTFCTHKEINAEHLITFTAVYELCPRLDDILNAKNIEENDTVSKIEQEFTEMICVEFKNRWNCYV